MDRACSKVVGGVHVSYLWESQKKRYHQDDQEVGVWIILRSILER
jgi:hypothetical protein